MPVKMTDPNELLIHELEDLYYAEKAITKSLPTMIREAGDGELSDAFEKHLDQTRMQVRRLEDAFELLGEKAKAEVCPGIEGLKKEHDAFMEDESPAPEIRDMFLTGAAGRVEHYEIAAYTSAIALARGLGETECAKLLNESLREEKEALRAVEGIGKRLTRDARDLAAV